MTSRFSVTATLLLLFATTPGPAADASPSRPPNVLLIYTDDHRADALGCAGNPHLLTPRIDRLAATGTRIKHPDYTGLSGSQLDRGHFRPIEIVGAADTRVEGITIADSASHSLMLIGPRKAGHPNTVNWTKIFTWRVNGDGINPFANTLVEDCFLRTQDDSLYVNGLGIRRTVIWNDANGSAFVLSSLPKTPGHPLVVEDCDVIYSRAKWHHWSGGRVFNMRGEGAGESGIGVVFRNINIEDPRPTLQQFFLCTAMPEPYSRESEKRGAGDIKGVHFINIAIAAPSVLGEPQILWGHATARLRDFTFENLTLGGVPVRESTFFKTNEFVDSLTFVPAGPKTAPLDPVEAGPFSPSPP